MVIREAPRLADALPALPFRCPHRFAKLGWVSAQGLRSKLFFSISAHSPIFVLPLFLRVIAPKARKPIALHLKVKETSGLLRLCPKPALIEVNRTNSLELGHQLYLRHVEYGYILDGLWVLQGERHIRMVSRDHHISWEDYVFVAFLELFRLRLRQPRCESFDLLGTSQRSRTRRVFPQRGECPTRRPQMDVVEESIVHISNDELSDPLVQQIGTSGLFNIHRTDNPTLPNQLLGQIALAFRACKQMKAPIGLLPICEGLWVHSPYRWPASFGAFLRLPLEVAAAVPPVDGSAKPKGSSGGPSAWEVFAFLDFGGHFFALQSFAMCGGTLSTDGNVQLCTSTVALEPHNDLGSICHRSQCHACCAWTDHRCSSPSLFSCLTCWPARCFRSPVRSTFGPPWAR